MTDWFRQWRVPLRKFLLGRVRVPSADLDDVAQEVFLRLLRYDKVELIEHPQAYLFKMASNVAAEWSIRARARRPHEPKWLTTLIADTKPEHDVLRGSAQDEIERALRRLTDAQREILKLFFSDGLGQAEIANRLGTTPRAVRRHLAKSYEKLRQELDTELLGVFTHGSE
jgi:RNA polymerase sigma factor (sigma-70 family)